MNNALLDVADLSFGYDSNEPVLQDVSFSIAKGQFVGVIGPNGGGKSTLFKLLLGLLTPWSGSILIQGKKPPCSCVAYVPQVFSFDKAFPITVLEVVLGGRVRHLAPSGAFQRKDIEIAEESLSKVGMLHVQKQLFGTLSGGQAQRVLIARALSSAPEILFLDEPTSSTDKSAESAIFEIICELKKDHTILMVTHNIARIIDHVEHILCVNGSVAQMAPKDICEHFALGLYHVPLINAHDVKGST